MPVTAKLSRKFYDKFGDEITNELVEWFNQVDATYRGDLRDLNELNFARFDAKLEQRMAELEARLDRRISGVEAKLDQMKSDLRTELAELGTRLTRWSFAFWATALGVLVALLKL